MSCWKDEETYHKEVKFVADHLKSQAQLLAHLMHMTKHVCPICAISATINAYGNALAGLQGEFMLFTPEQDAEFCRQLTQLIMTNNASHRCPPTPSEN